MNVSKKEYKTICDILERVLNAYNEDGSLSDNYSDNIILNDLSKEELEFLKYF